MKDKSGYMKYKADHDSRISANVTCIDRSVLINAIEVTAIATPGHVIRTAVKIGATVNTWWSNLLNVTMLIVSAWSIII